MTKEKSFKRLVRARMDKTGESYAAARAALLAATEGSTGAEPPVLATSDAEIRRRTGRGWEEWFALLDDWHADTPAHQQLARRVADELGSNRWCGRRRPSPSATSGPGGPGGQGGASRIERDRIFTRTTDSSARPLPDPSRWPCR